MNNPKPRVCLGYGTGKTNRSITIKTISHRHVRNGRDTKRLHSIPKRSPNPIRMIRNTEPEDQDSRGPYRARDDDSRESIFRDALVVAAAGHQVRGDDVDEPASDVEG